MKTPQQILTELEEWIAAQGWEIPPIYSDEQLFEYGEKIAKPLKERFDFSDKQNKQVWFGKVANIIRPNIRGKGLPPSAAEKLIDFLCCQVGLDFQGGATENESTLERRQRWARE